MRQTGTPRHIYLLPLLFSPLVAHLKLGISISGCVEGLRAKSGTGVVAFSSPQFASKSQCGTVCTYPVTLSYGLFFSWADRKFKISEMRDEGKCETGVERERESGQNEGAGFFV